MKMLHCLSGLFLLMLALSGCTSSLCKKNVVETPALETTQVVAAPVVPVAAQAPAPVAPAVPEEPVREKIPAAVLK